MMERLRERVRRLEVASGIGQPAIFFLDEHDPDDWSEQMTQAEELKAAGRVVVLVTQGHGVEVWRGTERVEDA